MIGLRPDQLPVSTLTVWPAVAVPEGFGCFVFAGAVPAAAIAPVAADSAWLLPSAFVRRHLNADRPADVVLRRDVVLVRRPADRPAAAPRGVAALPLVVVGDRRHAAPRAVRGRQGLPLLRRCRAMVGSELLTGGLAAVRTAAASAEPDTRVRTPAMTASNNGIRLIRVPLCWIRSLAYASCIRQNDRPSNLEAHDPARHGPGLLPGSLSRCGTIHTI